MKKKKWRRGGGEEGEERRMMRQARLKPVAWTARAGRGELTSWRSCCGWCGCRCEQSTKSELPCVDGFDGGGGNGGRDPVDPSALAASPLLHWLAWGRRRRHQPGGDHPWLCK